ncbi:MAG: DMT family transporter [Balneolaceae bacterium]
MKNIKGILFIAIGASSYGVLATFVKMANNNGISTGILTISQYFIGFVLLFIAAKMFEKRSQVNQGETLNSASIKRDSKMKLVLYGTSLGFTSSFYYLSIQYLPVSVGIILLMQSIWIGLVFEFFMARHMLNKAKVIGAITTIFGTLLAVNVMEASAHIEWPGIVFGLMAATTFATTMVATNSVALHLPTIIRSKYLVLGGFLTVLIFWNIPGISDFNLQDFDLSVFLTWGLFLAFFGTLLPPLLFSKGFPLTGVGLGSIMASLEIPVSVFSAYLLLEEQVKAIQWVGILIILLSVVIINRNQP